MILGLLIGGVVLGAMASGGGGSGAEASGPEPGRPVGDDDPSDDPVLATSSDRPLLPASDYAVGWAGLTAEEQLLVELANYARLNPQREAARLADDLAPGASMTPVEALAVVRALSTSARDHSQDMDDRAFFAHTNPDGLSPGDRAFADGHPSRYVSENIGYIASRSAPDAQARAEAHHAELWASDSHQTNLLSDAWSEIGMGYDYGDHNGFPHATFATQTFSDTGKTYLTGAVFEDADGDRFYDVGEGQGGVRITAWNDDGAHGTATWAAGGYTLALPRGTYKVAFEGAALDGIYETEVTIGDENVKLDLIEDASGRTVATLSAVPEAAPEIDGAALMAALALDMPVLDESLLADEDDPGLPVDLMV